MNLNILILSASLCTQKDLLEFSDVSVTVRDTELEQMWVLNPLMYSAGSEGPVLYS